MSEHADGALWRMQRLVTVIQFLSLVRTLPDLMAIVRQAARSLVQADGATFVLRENGMCHYADEDAIEPLWKGQRFPMESCISGWAMLNRCPVAIEDIYKDPRIPHDAYRPTFVKSLTMVPIRSLDPIGAIGVYWAKPHLSDASEILFVQALANSTAVALENLHLHAETESRLTDREARLVTVKDELRTAQARIGELEKIARVCAWTGRIEHEGKWVSLEKYLELNFGLAVSHGMSEEVLAALENELKAEEEFCAVRQL